jgi:hypothetical protein
MNVEYWTHEIVTDAYDPDYGSTQTVTDYYGCRVCGSLTYDRDMHSEWHWKVGT